MPSTEIDRRRLLGLLAGTAVVTPTLAYGRDTLPGQPSALYLSSRGDGRGGFFVSGFRTEGGGRFDLPLPGRGHAVAPRPGQAEAVVFARRPGSFALALDLRSGRLRHSIAAAPGRHFYGHGVFSADGRTLFTSENDYEAGTGVIGIRDAADGYRQIGEIPSHGIGPHDLRLLSDGRTLAVANGGVLTHPDSGRAKLNLPEMSPSLAYVEAASGRLLAEHRLPPALHRLSIRHLAVGPRDEVAIALQYEGPRSDLVPLVALHAGGGEIGLLTAPDRVLRRMRNYCGSAALDSGGEILGASCPRGGIVTFWQLRERRYLGAVELADGCGIAAAEASGAFLLTSGSGEVVLYRPAERSLEPIATGFGGRVQWDNHLTAWIGA